jgi:hypothetical protein
MDLSGKAGHVRTIPLSDRVPALLNEWTKAAGIDSGKLFRCVSSAGRAWGEAVTEKLVWHVVKEFAAKIGGSSFPHGIRSLRASHALLFHNQVAEECPTNWTLYGQSTSKWDLH